MLSNLPLKRETEEEAQATFLVDDLKAANDQKLPDSKKAQDGYTRINAAMREYVETLKIAIARDSGVIIRTAVKPKLVYLRGKGWYVLQGDDNNLVKIGDTADEVVKSWNKKTATLRRMFKLQEAI